MIIKKSPPNPYGDYFLAFEADDDQEQQEVRSNMKRINIRSSNRNRVDFTDGADEAPENTEVPAEDTASDAENQDVSTDAPEDDTNPDTSGDDENFNDDSSNPGEQQEENQESETSDEDQSGDGPDTSGDDENFNDDSEGEDSSNKTFDDVDNNDQNNQQNNNGPGLEYDSMRQYKLFIDYKELSESVKKYISNLETEIRDDSEIMKIYRDSIDKFRKINELLCDYMTLKFTASTYIQNLLFYQKMYTATELIIESLLKTIKNNN